MEFYKHRYDIYEQNDSISFKDYVPFFKTPTRNIIEGKEN